MAELEERKIQISQLQHTLEDIIKEKDAAIATLQSHNLHQHFLTHLKEYGGHVTKPAVPHDEISQQNEQLKSIISQMRQEMEQLSHNPQSGENGGFCSQGYIKYLENELMRVTTENRKLRAESKEDTRKEDKMAHKPPLAPPLQSHTAEEKPPRPSSPSMARHCGHLVALSETIVVLQREKTALELRVAATQSSLRNCQISLRETREEVKFVPWICK